jgi:hypothetical protein
MSHMQFVQERCVPLSGSCEPPICDGMAERNLEYMKPAEVAGLNVDESEAPI